MNIPSPIPTTPAPATSSTPVSASSTPAKTGSTAETEERGIENFREILRKRQEANKTTPLVGLALVQPVTQPTPVDPAALTAAISGTAAAGQRTQATVGQAATDSLNTLTSLGALLQQAGKPAAAGQTAAPTLAVDPAQAAAAQMQAAGTAAQPAGTAAQAQPQAATADPSVLTTALLGGEPAQLAAPEQASSETASAVLQPETAPNLPAVVKTGKKPAPVAASTNQLQAAANQLTGTAPQTPAAVQEVAEAVSVQPGTAQQPSTASVQELAGIHPAGIGNANPSGEAAPSSPVETMVCDTRSDQWVDQLAAGIERASLQGGTKLHVELRPEHLGKIEMDLSRTPEGLRIAITTEHAQTGHLLEDQLGSLRQTLSENGIQLAQLDIRQQSAGQRGWQNPHQNEAWANQRAAHKETRAAEVAAVQVERDSEVDYRV